MGIPRDKQHPPLPPAPGSAAGGEHGRRREVRSRRRSGQPPPTKLIASRSAMPGAAVVRRSPPALPVRGCRPGVVEPRVVPGPVSGARPAARAWRSAGKGRKIRTQARSHAAPAARVAGTARGGRDATQSPAATMSVRQRFRGWDVLKRTMDCPLRRRQLRHDCY
jgi:hypothetical protein